MLKRQQWRHLYGALTRAQFDLHHRLLTAESETLRRLAEEALEEVKAAKQSLEELPLDVEDWCRPEAEAA